MPTYQYACTNAECGNRFDLVQSFTDPSASACPLCGSPVRKVFSAVGVVFKGSGFYRTDSRASNGDGKAKTGESKIGESKNGDSTERPKKESSPASGSDGKSAGTSSSSESGSGSSAGSGTSASGSKPAGKAATPA